MRTYPEYVGFYVVIYAVDNVVINLHVDLDICD